MQYMMNYPKLRHTVILTRCDLIRAGLRTLLTDLSIEVSQCASAGLLRRLVQDHPSAELLVTDTDSLAESIEVAEACQLPLLVVAPTITAGVTAASTEAVRGVLITPIAHSALADALAVIRMGERYLAFAQGAPLLDGPFTERERELVALDLMNVSPEAVARWMWVELKTTYTYRSRIRRKLRRLSPAEQPVWGETWLKRFQDS